MSESPTTPSALIVGATRGIGSVLARRLTAAKWRLVLSARGRERLETLGIERLPAPVRSRLTLENNDKVYSPADLLPVCAETGVPMVYDVHHRRCLPDGLSVAETTEPARKTWKSEPLFHISSPLAGWDGPKPERHHDYINAVDFPKEWLDWPLTVEVEAKAKELAVARLLSELKGKG